MPPVAARRLSNVSPYAHRMHAHSPTRPPAHAPHSTAPQDQLGSCALLEACKYGHDDLIVTLKKARGREQDAARVPLLALTGLICVTD